MTSKKILYSQISVYVLLILIKLLLAAGLSSCGLKDKLNNELKENNTKTDKNNSAPDTLRYYYPVTLKSDDAASTTADTSMLSTLSGSLLNAKEPVIYSVDGHDVYRLLVFDMSIPVSVIALHKNNDDVWLTVKELSRPAFLKPQASGRYVPKLNSDGSIDSTANITYDEYESIKGMMSGNSQINVNIIHKFSSDTWDNMEYEVKNAGYWRMPAYQNLKNKGSHMILEGRVNNKYWLVDRINSDGEFKKCCDYLIGLQNIAKGNTKQGLDD